MLSGIKPGSRPRGRGENFPSYPCHPRNGAAGGKIGQRERRDPSERPQEKQVTRLKACYVMEFLWITGEFGGFNAIPELDVTQSRGGGFFMEKAPPHLERFK